MEAHTPGPWQQGRLLETPTTRKFSDDMRKQYDAEERRMVFANFSPVDEGRGRRRVAVCDSAEDARLIAAAPDLLAICKEFATCGMRTANDPRFERLDAAIAKTRGGA